MSDFRISSLTRNHLRVEFEMTFSAPDPTGQLADLEQVIGLSMTLPANADMALTKLRDMALQEAINLLRAQVEQAQVERM